MSNVHLRGFALDHASGQAIRGLQLEVGRVSRGRFQKIVEVTCRPDGKFQVPVDFAAGGPGATFEIRAYSKGQRLEIATGSWTFTQATAPTQVRLGVVALSDEQVDPVPAIPSSQRSVRGRITHVDGSPIVPATVRAWHRPPGGGWIEVQLSGASGSVSADAEGNFVLLFDDPANWSPALTTPLRLQVTSQSSAAKGPDSEIFYEPEAHVVVNLVSDDPQFQGDDRFKEMDDEFPTHLDGASYSQVGDLGVEMLAAATGRDQTTVQRFVDAKNLSVQAGSPTVPEEAFFALLQQGLPADMDVLTTMAPSRLAELMAAAVEANDAPQAIADNAATYAANLRTDAEYRGMADLGPYPLGSMLQLVTDTGMDDVKRRKFLRLRLDHEGPMTNFWTTVGNDTDLASYAESLHRMYDVHEVTLTNADMLQAIDEMNPSHTRKDIAAYSDTDWNAVLDHQLGGTGPTPEIPPEVPGTGQTQRDNYISMMKQTGERKYPNAYVRRRLIDRIANPSDKYQTFLTNNPDHDFTDRVTDSMVSGEPAPDRADVKSWLQEKRRLFQIAPKLDREDAMDKLSTDGLTSAWKVRRRGKRGLDDLAGTLGQDTADAIWERSIRVNAYHTNLLVDVLSSANNPDAVDGVQAEDLTTDTDFTDIFGGVGFCKCKHCRSLLGPAAYLVDLLVWLDERSNLSQTYLEVLDGRRPDIRHIKLSCDNTNTPIPYVDLALEVLEDAVVARTGVPAVDTTGWTAEELAANPAYLNMPAYDALAAATYPLTAPFHLYNAQADVFLGHVGVDRAELMEVYQTDISSVVTPSEERLAAARFGLSKAGLDCLMGVPSPESLWGMATGFETTLVGDVGQLRLRAGLTREDFLDMMEVKFWNPTGAFTLDSPEECDVDVTNILGSPANTDFERLMQFRRGLEITGWTWLELDKTISTLGWTDFDAGAVQSLDALARLQARTERAVIDLLSLWGTLDTREDRDEVDDPEVCLYDQLFNGDATANLRDATGNLIDTTFDLNGTRDELVTSGGPMSDHSEALQAAFGASEQDLLDAMADVGPGLTLTLAELSAVYRRIAIAKAIGLDVKRMLALRDLQWRDPVLLSGYIGSASLAAINGMTPTDGDVVVFDDATPGTPSASGSELLSDGDVAEYDSGWKRRISNEGGFPPAGVRLLVATGTALVGPPTEGTDDGKVAVFDGTSKTPTYEIPYGNDLIKVVGLGAFDESAVYVYGGAPPTGTWSASTAPMDPFADPAGALAFVDFARRALEHPMPLDTLLYVSDTRDLGFAPVGLDDWIQETLGEIRDSVTPKLDIDPVSDDDGQGLRGKMAEVGLVDSQIITVMNHLGAGGSITDGGELDVLDPYLDPAYRSSLYAAEPQDVEVRYSTVLTGLHVGIAKIEVREEIADRVATAFGLDTRTTRDLQSRSFDALAVTDWTDVLLDASFLDGTVGDNTGITRELQPAPFLVMDIFDKIAAIVEGLAVTHDEILVWLDDVSEPLSPIRLTELMVPDRFLRADHWNDVLHLMDFRDRLPAGEPAFYELWQAKIDLVVPTDFFDPLEERTGWSSADLLQVMQDSGEPLLSGPVLHRLARCGEMADLVQAPILQLQDWRYLDLDAAKADDIVGAVRGHYTDTSAWYRAARDVRDNLREQQRAALLAYIVATDSETPDSMALQAKYLLDPEMTPCRMSSRVKFAISAVQQFIQRGLLGLESADSIEFSDADRREWEWKKSYRVWEAARKVFLYPENWIEAELRDDKSHLFKDFESAIASDAMSQENVEEAVLEFMDGMLDLSHMRYISVRYEPDVGTHFLARPSSTPFTLFYRFRAQNGNWSQWERLGVELQSDHASVGLLNGRVFVFWLDFTENDANYDVTVSWTEKRAERWAPVRSREFGALVPVHPLSEYSFDAKTGSGSDPDKIKLEMDHVAERVVWWADGTVEFIDLGAGEDLTVLYYKRDLDDIEPPGTFIGVASIPLLGAAGPDRPSNVTREFGAFRTETTELILGPGGSPHGESFSNGEVLVLADAGELATLVIDPHSSHWHEGPAVVQLPDHHSYLVTSSWEFAEAYFFRSLDHPYAHTLVATARGNGVMAVMDPEQGTDLDRQGVENDRFSGDYGPTGFVVDNYPIDGFEFGSSEAFGSYNWELFFHVPFMVGGRFSTERRFEDAHRWYSVIFDPLNTDTSVDAAYRAWRLKPMQYPPESQVTDWATFTGATGDTFGIAERIFEMQVEEWVKDPFNPHALARLRSNTYQLATVMKYLDNLIAWGDDLFSRYSIESINEATTIYLLALHVLGERPEELPAREPSTPMSFDELSPLMGGLNNPILQIEDYTDAPEFGPTDAAMAAAGGGTVGIDTGFSWPTTPDLSVTYYFCVPANDKLQGYWDIVEDRLYKIRHCQDIDGQVRALPLFQPPIDPALLVRASALGIDLSTVLSDLQTPLPSHRFSVLLRRANALTGSLRALGGAMLSALEKRDAEAIALLRSTLEVDLQQAVTKLRVQQVESARSQRASAKASLKEAKVRRNHYERLISKDLLPPERKQRDRLKLAGKLDKLAGQLSTTASVMYMGPNWEISAAGACSGLTTRFGFDTVGKAFDASARAIQIRSGRWNREANIAGINAGHRRRKQDWRLQLRLANKQIDTLEKQIVTAEIGVELAEKELDNHKQQVRNLREVDDQMRRKFTNQELYAWQVGELSKLYFQTYQIANDVARRAERCYQHELAEPNASFIVPGHFDSLKKGLLAGERLQFQLDQMDASYLEKDIREFELVKHVSLREIDPLALVRLVEEGGCYFSVSEALFDQDVPSQWLRRLKGVSLTIPGVTGPYATVNARLTMHSSSIRSSDLAASLDVDNRVESIITSGRPDDAGLFQFDFNDPKYLPFERRGAVALWGLELTNSGDETYDPRSIDDVILTLRYTARDGSRAVNIASDLNAREEKLDASGTSGASLPALGFSVKQVFPDAWYAFKNGITEDQVVIPLADTHFPYLHKVLGISLASVTCFLVPESGQTAADADITGVTGGTSPNPEDSPLEGKSFTISGSPGSTTVSFAADKEAVYADLLMVFRYTL